MDKLQKIIANKIKEQLNAEKVDHYLLDILNRLLETVNNYLALKK